MKTLVVIFFGLVSHVNQPWSLDNTAVLPAVHGHAAEMRVPMSAVIDPDPWLSQFRRQTMYVIPLEGMTVRIRNTRGMFSDKRPEFFSSVPRLKKLAPGCKLSQAVRRRNQSDHLAAFVDYRGGRLTTESFYAQKLILAGGDPTGTCVACKVRYEADLHDGEAQLIFARGNERHTVRVAGGSTLNVDNILRGDANPAESHFGAAFSIFEGCASHDFERGDACDSSPLCDTLAEIEAAEVANAAEMRVAMVAGDEQQETGPPPFPGPDCTNSHYP
jgi:hypothetical protein